MRNDKDNLIVDLTFNFSLAILRFFEKLESDKKYILARQMLKSGTSIGANVREAQNAKSKVDFIHTFKITAKEADETEYRLLLCGESEHHPNPEVILEELQSIIRIISKISAHRRPNLQIIKS